MKILVKNIVKENNVVYKVIIYESKTDKQFASLKNKFSKEVWDRMFFFKNYPILRKKRNGFSQR